MKERILSIVKFYLAVIVVAMIGLAISFVFSAIVDAFTNRIFSVIALWTIGVGLVLLAMCFYRSLDLKQTGPRKFEVFTKRGRILQLSNFIFSMSLFFFIRGLASILTVL